jgi:sugar lactone lactonase YvrE
MNAEFFRSGASPEYTLSSKVRSSDGPLDRAGFRSPVGIAVNKQGHLFVADFDNHNIRSISPLRQVTTWAGMEPDTGLQDTLQAGKVGLNLLNAIPFCEVVVAANGTDAYAQFCKSLESHFYNRSIAPRLIHRISGGVVQTLSVGLELFDPQGFGVDSDGDFYVEGKRYSSSGQVRSQWRFEDGFLVKQTTVSRQGGVLMTNGEQLYFSSPGLTTASVLVGRRRQPDDPLISMDGTGSAAGFLRITGLAFDASGNAYVTDSYSSFNSPFVQTLIRKVSPTGEVKTLAGRPGVWGADEGRGANASFRDARGLTVDRKGNVYVADTGNHTIRRITPDGVVSTVVGQTGKAGVSLGPLPGRLTSPTAVAIDDNNLLYIATPGAVLRVRMPE